MKTGKIILSMAAICLVAVITVTGCKKKATTDTTATTTTPAVTPDSQSGTDNRDVQSENDNAVNDANNIISNSKRASGRSASAEGVTGICGFDVDSLKITSDTILLKYNGVTCNNRTKTGIIRLSWQPNTKWKNVGAVIKVDYINYKVVRASDQKSYMLNGTQNLTNVSGGTWVDLVLSNQTLVNTVTGTNLQVTFEDNKTAVYNFNRKITYTFPNSIITVKAEGIGTSGILNNLENFGTARNGDAFTSQVITPIVWNATCGGAVLQGDVSLTDVTKNINLTFLYGVDVNGNTVTVGPNQCPYGWKLGWTVNGSTNSKVFGYN